MKYIRYYIALILLGSSITGIYFIFGLFNKLGIFHSSVNFNSIFFLSVLLLIPIVGSFFKEKNSILAKVYNLNSNHLTQEVLYFIKKSDYSDWKNSIKDTIKRILYKNVYFESYYEDGKGVLFRSDELDDFDRDKGKVKNRIIIEVAEEQNGEIKIKVYKENRIIEVSNLENEEVMERIILGLQYYKKEES